MKIEKDITHNLNHTQFKGVEYLVAFEPFLPTSKALLKQVNGRLIATFDMPFNINIEDYNTRRNVSHKKEIGRDTLDSITFIKKMKGCI